MVLKYRNRPIKRIVRVQVGKSFGSRDFVKHSYNRSMLPDKARGKVCDLVWVTSGGKFMRGRSLSLAGPPKSAKNGGGVRLFKTVQLIRQIRYPLSLRQGHLMKINPASRYLPANKNVSHARISGKIVILEISFYKCIILLFFMISSINW